MCAWAVWPSQIPKSQAQRRACLQATMMDHAKGGRRQRRTTPKSRHTRSVRQHAGATRPSAGAGAGAAQTRKTASCNAPPLLSLLPFPPRCQMSSSFTPRREDAEGKRTTPKGTRRGPGKAHAWSSDGIQRLCLGRASQATGRRSAGCHWLLSGPLWAGAGALAAGGRLHG